MGTELVLLAVLALVAWLVFGRRRVQPIAAIVASPATPSITFTTTTTDATGGITGVSESTREFHLQGRAPQSLEHESAAQEEFRQWATSLGGRLEQLKESDPRLAPDTISFFRAGARYDKRGQHDPLGAVHLTDKRFVFVSPDSTLGVPWSKILLLEREGSVLKVHRSDRQAASLFDFHQLVDAMRAELIATNLWNDPTITHRLDERPETVVDQPF